MTHLDEAQSAQAADQEKHSHILWVSDSESSDSDSDIAEEERAPDQGQSCERSQKNYRLPAHDRTVYFKSTKEQTRRSTQKLHQKEKLEDVLEEVHEEASEEGHEKIKEEVSPDFQEIPVPEKELGMPWLSECSTEYLVSEQSLSTEDLVTSASEHASDVPEGSTEGSLSPSHAYFPMNPYPEMQFPYSGSLYDPSFVDYNVGLFDYKVPTPVGPIFEPVKVATPVGPIYEPMKVPTPVGPVFDTMKTPTPVGHIFDTIAGYNFGIFDQKVALPDPVGLPDNCTCTIGVLCQSCRRRFCDCEQFAKNLRLCKGKRDRYRKFIARIQEDIQQDPFAFDLESTELPQFISRHPAAHAKAIAELRQMWLHMRWINSGKQDAHRPEPVDVDGVFQ